MSDEDSYTNSYHKNKGDRIAKNNKNKSKSDPRLDEFPEEFDVNFFHNHLVESNKDIAILRYRVYKKIKDQIINRIKNYTDNVQLSDSFEVVFSKSECEEFSLFSFSVLREELMERDFIAELDVSEMCVMKFTIQVSRNISPTGPISKSGRSNVTNSDDDE